MDRKTKANQRNSGFVDSDLKTDDHDRIMLWLNENVNSIMQRKFDREVTRVVWEHPIVKGYRQYKSIVGYIDMLVKCKSPVDEEGFSYEETYAFEVKSRISNVGETIRQIRQYQTYKEAFRPELFIVVCPDDRFSHVLRSQGIAFMQCPEAPASQTYDQSCADWLF